MPMIESHQFRSWLIYFTPDCTVPYMYLDAPSQHDARVAHHRIIACESMLQWRLCTL